MPIALSAHLPALRKLPGERLRALALAAAGVLTVHALLLGLWPQTPGRSGARGPTLQARQVWRPPAAVPSAAPAPEPTGAQARPTARASAPASRVEAAVESNLPKLSRADRPSPRASDAQETAPQPDAGGLPPPLYATRLPPSFTLRYELRRGGTRGRAELVWQPQADRYELTLSSRMAGAQALGSASRGWLAAEGLAPERDTESRRGRDLRAVNFQREAGRITFSGPQAEYPWLPGAQDRLSGLVQLAAIVQADPALPARRNEVALHVLGARDDAEAWRFAVVGRETTDGAADPVAGTWHLRRESLRRYDPQVDVWLDPARHHLPLRLSLSQQATGEVSDFLLESLAFR